MTSIQTSTTAALATLAVLALGAPLFAQEAMEEPMMMESGQAMMAMPSGEMMMGMMDEQAMTMAVEGAEPVPEGTIFFVMDGQLMMVGGMMMEDGTIMMMPQ